MIVSFRDMIRLPLARHALMTIGSISGIKPTATDKANVKDSSQLPPVMPSRMNTIGIKIAMNLSMTNAMELAPF